MITYHPPTNQLRFITLTQERDALRKRPPVPVELLVPEWTFPALLVNQCPFCGRIVRAYWELTDDRTNPVNLEYYIYDFQSVHEGKYQGAFGKGLRTSTCECDADLFPRFSLAASCAAWLEKQHRQPDPLAVASMVATLQVGDWPGLRVIRDQITGQPTGLADLKRVRERGGYAYKGQIFCGQCYAHVYQYNKDNPCPKCGAPPSEFVDVQNTEGYDDYRQRVEQAERGLYEALGLVYDVPDEADLAGAAEDDDPEGFFVLAIEGEDEPASDDDPAPASQCDPTGDAIWGADI